MIKEGNRLKIQRRKIRSKILKKLNSTNLFVLICANTGIPFLAIPIARIIMNYQLELDNTTNIAIFYYQKIEFLILAFIMLGLLVLNVVYIFNPLVRLENLINDFRESKETIIEFETCDQNSALEATFFKMLNEQKESMERIYKSEVLRQETELIALQSQINPHFLYNTLDSIRGLALLNDVKEIADMTEALSKLFRNMIAKEGKLITLEEEFEAVENYMIIQQFRFNNKFEYVKKIEDEEVLKYKVSNLILQPIVENAIMHGLEKKHGRGKVVVSAYATERRLIINVEDNGLGISTEKLEYLNSVLKSKKLNQNDHSKSRMGIALTNINQRIQLQFGSKYGINIMSTKNLNTVVELVLPLIIGKEAV